MEYILPGKREITGYHESSSIKEKVDNTGAESVYEINAFLTGVEVKGGIDIKINSKKDE